MLSAKKEFLRILQKLWDNCKINVQKRQGKKHKYKLTITKLQFKL